MNGGHPRHTGALAAISTRPQADGQPHERHLRLVHPIEDETLDELVGQILGRPRERRVSERRAAPDVTTDDRVVARTPDSQHVGVITATVAPSVLAAIVAFAGHAVVLRELGLDSFGTLILVHVLTAAIVGLAGLGVPGLIRSAPDLTVADARATGSRLAPHQLVATLLGVGAAIAAATALAGNDVLATAGLFGLAAAATVRSATASAIIERAGEYRSGAAAALGTSVIWLAALLACIELGRGDLALPAAAAIAEVIRAIGSWRVTVAIGRRARALASEDDTEAPRAFGLIHALPFLPVGLHVPLLAASGLAVIAAFGTGTELGTLAAVAVVLRFVLLPTPLVEALGPAFVDSGWTAPAGRIWHRAARLTDALVVPVAVGAVAAFAIGAPTIGRIVGGSTSNTAIAIGLVLLSAPATHLLHVADVALRTTDRHLLGNGVIVARLAIVGGLAAGGAVALDPTGDAGILLLVAGAWAVGEWLAAAVVIAATAWRPLDLPTIATLFVLGAAAAGLFTTDGLTWDPPRIALASMLAMIVCVSVPRAIGQLRRIDLSLAQNLTDRPTPSTT